jgi:hypothetical protein
MDVAVTTTQPRETNEHRGPVKRALDWLFRDRETGKIVIFQWPNVPLWIFIVASVAKRFLHPHGTLGTALTVVVVASLLWWAGDEVLRGVNPFRRILGGVVIVLTVAGLLLR